MWNWLNKNEETTTTKTYTREVVGDSHCSEVDCMKKKKGSKIEVFKGKNKQYYFRFKSANGKIVAQSEGYKRLRSAIKGAYATQDIALAVDELTILD